MPTTRTALAVTGSTLTALALAGCAPSASASAPASASPAVPPGTTFKDGTYSSTGHYTSPGGPSAIAVTMTLKNGTVTAVHVVPKAENPTAVSYESRFASGVGGQVVGKKLTALNVTTVSGSSLTSQGFDKAVAAIEAQAKQ